MILFQKSLGFVRLDHMAFVKISLINSDRMKQPGYRYPPWKIEKLKLKGVSIGKVID